MMVLPPYGTLQHIVSGESMILIISCEISSSTKDTPILTLTCIDGLDKILRRLIQKNPEQINVVNSENQTPLHVALEANQQTVIKMLESTFGMDFDSAGRTPLMLAIESMYFIQMMLLE